MNTLIKNCIVCKKVFKKPHTSSLTHWEKAKFCSRKCFYSQHKPWQDKKRPQMTEWLKDAYKTGKKKVVLMFETDNPAWMGDRAGYYAIHKWIESRFGKPRKCEICKSTKKRKYEWASIDHRYKRDRLNFMRLCTSCHRKWDIENNNYQYKYV